MGVEGKNAWAALLFCGLMLGAMAGGFFGLFHDLPEINQLKQFRPSAASTVLSSDQEVITRFYLEKRFPVPIDQIPWPLIQALLATEDRDFFSHSGVNLKAVARAVIQDIKAGSFKQGASTLTQQLAKTLFLSPEKSMVRKIREALLAVQIERRYTKDQILELYLNQIYLGSGAYGVEAAARTYFNTSVSGLTLGQAALIAGLPKAPSVYSPLKNPDLARKRRSVVLKQMLESGYINAQDLTLAENEPVVNHSDPLPSDQAPYFSAYLTQELQAIADLDTANGLVIQTSLDLSLQKKAQAAMETHLTRLEGRMRQAGIKAPSPQGALVAIDVATGGIRCMIGGRDFTESSFNRSVQARRQPGSAFKPLVYAAALEQGWEQTRTLLDAPLSYHLDGQRTWEVNNDSRTFGGEMTLRKALALSKNTPCVRLAEALGPKTLVAMAVRAGITAALPPYPSLALGTAEVSLLEMTSAYASFANQGIWSRPHGVTKILTRDGQVRYQPTLVKVPVVSRVTAALITDMLRAVVLEGTARKAASLQKEVAGKTGTTDRFKDALFIGYSPNLVCGVWVGNDDAAPLGQGETGAKVALPIWMEVMAAVLEEKPAQYFDIPDGTKVVYMLSDSGRIVSQDTPGAVRALVRDDRTP